MTMSYRRQERLFERQAERRAERQAEYQDKKVSRLITKRAEQIWAESGCSMGEARQQALREMIDSMNGKNG